MLMDLHQVMAFAEACAPDVAASTLASVVQVESGFDPLAIGVNGRPRRTISPTDPTMAATQARALIAAGRNIDLGLAQINSANLVRLGLSISDAFDPCRNLAAAARLLREAYARNRPEVAGAQAALRAALSVYNTGDPRRGFSNGYVARVTAAAAQVIPALHDAPATAPAEAAEIPPARRAWDVFGDAPAATFLIRLTLPTPGAAR